MSEILCITNRLLCNENFLTRIEKIAAQKPKGIILREKDLHENEYMTLAQNVMKICKKYGTACILHSFTGVAIELGATAIHLPLPIFRNITMEEKKCFSIIGVSCHSTNELEEAIQLGCTYVTAGHIFNTDCKKGLPGRGLEFLTNFCDTAKSKGNIPVYALGGISPNNCNKIYRCGVAGVCIMSGIMQCNNVSEYLSNLS